MPRIFSPLYDRVLQWSRHRHAERYLYGLTVAEATFFPIPPDVMLAPMVLADRRRAWRLAAFTTVASVLGGLIGYLLGWLALEAVMPLIERAGQVGTYERAVAAFQQYGIWFVLVAGFSPIPYKLITIAAGALGMPLLGFVLASVVGRGGRFFLVAALIYLGGEQAAARLRTWVDALGWLVVAAVLVAGIVVWAMQRGG
jgi:membrane protein YqaA with SNARE-associated domain